MKIEFVIGALVIVGGGLYARGPIAGDLNFDMPIETAYAKVADMEMPTDFSDLVKQVPGSETSVERVQNKSVTWRYAVNGEEAARFTVELEPDGDKAVKLSVKHVYAVEDGPVFSIRKTKPPAAAELNPMLSSVGETALAERLEATMENRRLDRSKVVAAVNDYRADNPAPVVVEAVSAVPRPGSPQTDAPKPVEAMAAAKTTPAPARPSTAPTMAPAKLQSSPVAPAVAPASASAPLQTATAPATVAANTSAPAKPWQRPYRDVSAYIRSACRN